MQNPTITIYNGTSTATVEIMPLSSYDHHQCGRRLPALVTDTYARVTHHSCLRKLQASRKAQTKGREKRPDKHSPSVSVFSRCLELS